MIPVNQPHYKEKPAGMISHLIGHEGKGKILVFCLIFCIYLFSLRIYFILIEEEGMGK